MDKTKKIDMIKFAFFLVAAFAVFTFTHDLAKELLTSEFADVKHYYLSCKLLREGHNIWELSEQGMERAMEISRQINVLPPNHYPLPIHSQGFFLMFMPFSFLPYRLASILWVLMTNIAFVAGIILIFKYFDNIPFFKAMTGLFLVLSIWPLREEMLFGQPNIFIFFLFCASLFCLKKRWYLPAGLLIGLGITTKEIFFLVFLFLLWQRNWKAIFSAISVMLVMRVVPIILFGWPTELSYWHYFYRLWIADNGRGSCISFYEIFHRAFDNALSPEMIKTMLVSVNIALFILTWKWIRKVRFHSGLQQNALALSMFLLLSMLISPWLRETHLVVVCLPILACWFCLDEELERKYFILFTVGYLLVGLKYSVNSFPAFASGILALAGLLKVFGCAVLFCLSGRLLAHRV